MGRVNQELDETKVQVSAVPCKVRGFYFQNPNTYPVFVKFFNALSANVTMGTTAPTWERQIPAGDGTTQGWICENNFNHVQFDATTGLTIAATKLTGIDNTALASNIKAEVFYE